MKDPKEQRLKELHGRFQSINRRHDRREGFQRLLHSPKAWLVVFLCLAIMAVLLMSRLKT